MSLSLTNRKDIVADSIGVITENEIVDLSGAISEKAPQITTYTKHEVNNLLNNLSDTTVAVNIYLPIFIFLYEKYKNDSPNPVPVPKVNLKYG